MKIYFCKFAFLNNKLKIKTEPVPSCLSPLGLLVKVLPDPTVRFNFGWQLAVPALGLAVASDSQWLLAI